MKTTLTVLSAIVFTFTFLVVPAQAAVDKSTDSAIAVSAAPDAMACGGSGCTKAEGAKDGCCKEKSSCDDKKACDGEKSCNKEGEKKACCGKEGSSCKKAQSSAE